MGDRIRPIASRSPAQERTLHERPGVLTLLNGLSGVSALTHLDGPKLRLRVALEQAKAIDAAVKKTSEAGGYAVSTEIDASSKRHIVRVNTGDLEPIWGIRIGEALHNLRAALDGLTWEVAALHTPSPMAAYKGKTPRMQFPIFLNAGKPGRHNSGFLGVGVSVHLEHVSLAHRSVFESQQPYSAGNGNATDPLWILKELNDSDKHRLIHVTAFNAGTMAVATSEKGREALATGAIAVHLQSGQRVEHGARILSFDSELSVDPEVHVKLSLGLKICFGDTCECARGLWVPETLSNMCRRVDAIIKSFEPLFQ